MVCYSILHYQNIDVTYDCISSIINANRGCNDYFIVIVDNNSPNHTGEALLEKYKNETYVKVILNKENGGFSKGNNIGYQYARNVLKCESIVVMNSDIVVDANFNSTSIARLFQETSADVIGPDIYTKSGSHQNPLLVKDAPIMGSIFACVKNIVLATILSVPLLSRRYYKHYVEIKNKKPGIPYRIECFDYNNFTPHGSCVLFGNKWVESEEIAFLPLTFLYEEEVILKEIINRKKYKIHYCDSISLLHLGEATVSSEFESGRKKIIFKSLQQNKAIFAFIKFKLFGICKTL